MTRVVVVGAGKMGLPLAAAFAGGGCKVTACDTNPEVVKCISEGRCAMEEPGLAKLLSAAVREGNLSATSATADAVKDADVVVVIVPVVLTPEREADLSKMEAATKEVSRGLRAGTLVCFETTLPVGTTRKVLVPILEAGGLKAGKDFDVVFSPERVKSGSVLAQLKRNPKVVGGLTPEATERAARFYAETLGCPVIRLESAEASELAKLAGMLYRDVNIALANELAAYSAREGVDFGPVIEAANTDGESSLLLPGIGVGGHCTPVYPYFLTKAGRAKGVQASLAEAARRINDEAPGRALARVEAHWGPLKGRRMLILGLAFRPQVKEHICSPVFLLRDEAMELGAEARVHDPLYTDAEISGLGFAPGSLDSDPAPEVVVLNTSHRAFAGIDFTKLASQGVKVVVDGRNLWSPDTVRKAGLAYFGVGRPFAGTTRTQASAIPVCRPFFGAEEEEAVRRVISSGWIGPGPEVQALEREFASFVSAPHACAVSSATTGLHLALLAAGVKAGDEVITVSHSFIATANSIRYCGGIPVFVDIAPSTFNMDPSLVERLVTSRTKAILAVHQIGMPCDLKAIIEIGRRHGLAVLEDAAGAIGSEILWQGQWQRLGRPHADAAVFSFHPRKVITTGEGGMITTAKPEWDRLFRLWRNHGILPGTTGHSTLGYNYRMTDLQAAVGREQLKRVSGFVKERRRIAERYAKLLPQGFRPPAEPSWARSNWQGYCVRLPDGLSQEDALKGMASKGIDARPGIGCAHVEPAYAEEPWTCGSGPGRCACGATCARLTQSVLARDRCVILPLFPGMREEESAAVVQALGASRP